MTESLRYIFVAALVLLSLQSTAVAQEEGPPLEAPYVEETNEFDVDTPEDSVLADEKSKNSVNLNEQDPSSDSTAEDLAIEDEMAVPTSEEPVIAVPTGTPAESLEDIPKGRVAKKTPKGGVEYIQHPQAKKGLMRIDSDGSYIYRIEEEKDEFNHTASLRVGAIEPPNIVAVDGTTFEVMYSDTNVPIVSFDYEWQPFSNYGKLGLVGGFGLLTAQGQGHFIDGSEAEESYTFYAIPLNVGAVYRLEWMNRQWFAPYISGGGTYIGVMEMRDDDESPKFLGVPGAYGAGGILFNITAIDRDTAFNLRSEYGIKNLWVSLEYRHLQTFNDELDFTSGIFSLGVTADY